MKIRFNHLSILILLFFVQIVVGQVNSDLRPAVKSPEVNKFEQYINMPVNLVSGTPQVSIPIYTLEYGGMTVPISLEYDASGVKVENIASSVGQNWSLNVGGAVSRIVKGAPDEGNPYRAFYEVSQIGLNGYYSNNGLSLLNSAINNITSTDPDIGKLGQFNKWMTDCYKGVKDSQPDLFYFSTPEGGAKFVFNNNKEIVYLENTDFIIDENLDSFTNAFTWNATSPNGIKYSFGANGMSEKAYSTYVGYIPDNRYLINSWFLTELNNNATNDKISISYIDNYYSQVFNNKPVQTTTPCLTNLNLAQSQCDSNYGETSYTNFASNPYSTSVDIMALQNPKYMENHTSSKLISKITAGKTEINFIYNNDRQDIYKDYDTTTYPNPKELDEIDIFQDGQCIKKYIFNYTIFTSDDYQSTLSLERKTTTRKRFFLNKLTETSCTGTIAKPYVFEYNNPQLLPNKLSFAQDKWGFYNGKTTNASLFPKYKFYQNSTVFADRSVDTMYCKSGSLARIVYPTKGSVNFKYESNKSDVAVDYKYDPLAFANMVTNINPLPATVYPYDGSYNEQVFTYHNSDEALFISSTLYCPHPAFTLSSCGQYSFTSKAVEIIDNVSQATIAVMYYNAKSATGVQLSATNTSIAVSQLIDPSLLVDGKTYTCKVYGQGYYGHCLHNYTTIEKHHIVPIYDVGGIRVSKITYKDADATISKVMNYSYSTSNIISNPLPFYKINYNYDESYNSLYNISGFSNVEYLKTTSYSNPNSQLFWKGSYYYLSPGTDPLDINFMGPQISYDTIIESDENGSTKHMFNKYKSYADLYGYPPLPPTRLPADPVFQSILAGEKSLVTAKNTNNTDVSSKQYDYNYTTSNTSVIGINIGNTDNVYPFYVYTLKGQIKTLKTETETTKLGGQDVTTTKDYEYRTDSKHFQPIKITTTDNSGNQKLITKMYYPDDMGTAPYMSNLLVQNRKSKPIKIETFRGTTAVTDKLSEQQTIYGSDPTTSNLILPKSVYAAKFPNFNTPITTPNVGALEKKVSSDLYDSSGNLLQFTPDSGVPVAIIWGYNKTQPIAKIENATYAQVEALSGFGAGFSVVTTLTPTQETTLRTSLSSAMITTYTYIPLVGVSTITDPKGDKTTYTYDAFNRLQSVKDKDGNILSENEYHYKN